MCMWSEGGGEKEGDAISNMNFLSVLLLDISIKFEIEKENHLAGGNRIA